MDIYVLNQNLARVAVIDDYESIIWTTRYFTYGDFELVIGANQDMVTLLQAGMYLVREQDCSEGEYRNVMIISNREIQSDAENGDNLIVTGYCLKSILSRRVVANQTMLSGTVETCIQQLVTENIISPSDSSRAISNFTLGTDNLSTSESMQMQITGKNLSDAISEICATYGYGYDIYISGTNFVFYLYEGTDRSYDQSINPHVVFSTEFDNLLSSNYKENQDNYANVAIVAGEGQGTARKKVTVGTATGLDRYEIWVDDRNVSSNDGEISETEYNALLTQNGEEKLSETTVTTSFEGEILSNVNYILGQDYFLGDLVQIENDYGISSAARIIEIIESQDENGTNIIPTFSEMKGV